VVDKPDKRGGQGLEVREAGFLIELRIKINATASPAARKTRRAASVGSA